ncbi:DNA (cytosine-5)-methyltransferase [Olea europaea subsp. europaea]|uniref:DNA (Cytosine-5)-methyltransferase n=1 Tax=Olea europaea subsp. europaea TaxID=158383 RepID=A0A8S0TS80_OLEEU|nr:DNA (cytosine-5)-methyltransferase [Olea europaea subsp. europaea]
MDEEKSEALEFHEAYITLHYLLKPRVVKRMRQLISYKEDIPTLNLEEKVNLWERDVMGVWLVKHSDVGSGASKTSLSVSPAYDPCAFDPISWFQKKIRGTMEVLPDHLLKETNEFIRNQTIPKWPGAYGSNFQLKR